MQEFYIIRGTHGSSKSHTAKKLGFMAGITHFEADMFFIDKDGNYKFDFNNLAEAHDWFRNKVRNILSHRASACVSNTFTTIRELRPYFDIAKEFGLIPNVITCQSNFGNVHNVPQESLDKMKARFVYDLSPLFESLRG